MLGEDAVELRGLQLAGLGQLQIERGEESRERLELLLRGRVVDAVDQRRALRLERLGRGDIGCDHELLDQAVRIEPGGLDDAPDAAFVVEQDLALGQVEVERRRARRARARALP